MMSKAPGPRGIAGRIGETMTGVIQMVPEVPAGGRHVGGKTRHGVGGDKLVAQAEMAEDRSLECRQAGATPHDQAGIDDRGLHRRRQGCGQRQTAAIESNHAK